MVAMGPRQFRFLPISECDQSCGMDRYDSHNAPRGEPDGVMCACADAQYPANTKRELNAEFMLAHRLRRWPNFKPALSECSMLYRTP